MLLDLNLNCLVQHVEELRVAREETVRAESKATQLLSDTSSLQAREQELVSSLAGLQSQHDQCQATQVSPTLLMPDTPWGTNG